MHKNTSDSECKTLLAQVYFVFAYDVTSFLTTFILLEHSRIWQVKIFNKVCTWWEPKIRVSLNLPNQVIQMLTSSITSIEGKILEEKFEIFK